MKEWCGSVKLVQVKSDVQVETKLMMPLMSMLLDHSSDGEEGSNALQVA